MNAKVINLLNRLITYSVYTIYPLVLIGLTWTRDERVWRVFLGPAISFILVSVFRNLINAPRPYEVNNTVPLITKDTKGKSFPSRHVFSVFVVASTLYFISSPLGISLMLAGVLLAFLRVIGGVHFKRDVIVGAIVGIASGVLAFYI